MSPNIILVANLIFKQQSTMDGLHILLIIGIIALLIVIRISSKTKGYMIEMYTIGTLYSYTHPTVFLNELEAVECMGIINKNKDKETFFYRIVSVEIK